MTSRNGPLSVLAVVFALSLGTVAYAAGDDLPAALGDGRDDPVGRAEHEVPLAPPPREVLFDYDVPAAEIKLGDYFDPAPAFDSWLNVFSNAAGEVAALVREDFQLQALYSSDGGASWTSEVTIAGVQGPGGVWAAHTAFDGDETIYLATDFADAEGSCGVQFFRSEDMGRTWSDPVVLVSNGDDTHGVDQIRIAANGSGRVAVAYLDGWSGDPYVRVSSDGGSSWTTRVRVDTGVAEGQNWATEPFVAVDDAGIVHVAYAQDRTSGYAPTWTYAEIFYTRSTDGGATFEAERSLDSVLPPGERAGARYPHVVVAEDDSLLIAFWDEYSTDRLYVVRSTDAGANFQMSLNLPLSNTGVERAPFLAASPDDGTVMVILRQSNGWLWISRSTDHGASFGAPTTLANQANALNRYNVARTPDGEWVVAWEDRRSDGYAQWMRDVYVKVSTDDGVTWSAEQRANGGAAGDSITFDVRVSPVGNGDLLVGYLDCRGSTGGDCNVYVNTSDAQILSFGMDQRIDGDRENRSVAHYTGLQVAADGAGHVYAAVPAIDQGPYKDIHVVRSADGGYTFQPAQRVSTVPEGSLIVGAPHVVATADGHVYVAYKSRTPSNAREIRINSSSDYGATWMPADTFLGYGTNSTSFANHPEMDIAAIPGGTVYMTWSNGVAVYLATSTDGGATYTIQTIDQAATARSQPNICAQGDQIVVTFRGDSTVWAVTSDDRGLTWASSYDLRRPTAAGTAAQPSVTCGDTDKAVAVWTENRYGVYEIFSARFNGTNWDSSARIGDAMPWNGQFYPVVTYTSSTQVVAAYHQYDSSWFNWDLSTYAVASNDGGQTFGTPQRMDAGLREGTRSVHPHLAGDAAGNVWVAWIESTAYQSSAAVRHSADGGQTWNAVHRLNRESPQGFYLNDSNYWAGDGYVAAESGVAYFVWAGERSSSWREGLLQAYDLDDFDRDTSASGVDCNDSDPTALALPVLVGDLAAEKLPGATRLSWAGQAATAGSGTRYEVVSGDLSDLRSSGSYAAASCLVADLDTPVTEDARSGPDSGDAFYYLVRALNSCGSEGFGDSTESPDPRDDLDAASPCP